jgi:hypothetical protein
VGEPLKPERNAPFQVVVKELGEHMTNETQTASMPPKLHGIVLTRQSVLVLGIYHLLLAWQ